MTTDTRFDLLREWAATLAEEYAGHAKVQVEEPSFQNGALVVDIELDRALAQVLLWPSGMIEVHHAATGSGEEIVTESHEAGGAAELVGILGQVKKIIDDSDG